MTLSFEISSLHFSMAISIYFLDTFLILKSLLSHNFFFRSLYVSSLFYWEIFTFFLLSYYFEISTFSWLYLSKSLLFTFLLKNLYFLFFSYYFEISTFSTFSFEISSLHFSMAIFMYFLDTFLILKSLLSHNFFFRNLYISSLFYWKIFTFFLPSYYSGRFTSTAAHTAGFWMHKFPFKVIQGNLSEGRCSWVRETAELVLCFLGQCCGILGKLTTGKLYWRHLGAKGCHLWMRLKLSRAMVILSGFWRAMLDPFGGAKCKDRSDILGPDWGQVGSSCALLRYVEATALLLGRKVGGSWEQVKLSGGHVEGYVMSCWSHMSDFVRPCCWFCTPFRVKYGLLMATLVLSWGQLRRFWGCDEGYMESFWTMLLRHSQKQPTDTPPKRLLALKARQNQIKNWPKTQKLRQNANLHGSKGKP